MYEKYLEKLEEAGKIRNLKERSINCYKNYVSYFLNYVDKAPEKLTCQDVRDFLLAKKDGGLKATTLNLYNSAIRFFYRNVLNILWDDIMVPRMIQEHKLPIVLTADEIDHLLDAVNDIKYKAMFAIMYSSGLRVSEVIHLHYDDIYDMLHKIEDEMFLEFNEIMEQKPVVTNSLASQGPLLEFFRFLDRNRDLAKVMIGPHGDLAFVNRLKDQIEKRTLQVLESAQSDANYKYLCSFIITGCVGVVETWLKESDPQSPEEMAEILGAMLLRQLNFAPGPA